MQQLVERGRIDAGDRLLFRDQLVARHFDGDLERRLGGALAGTGLQHPEFAALDGEFEILHVAVVLLQPVGDRHKGLERFRHQFLQRRLVGAGGNARCFGDVLRRADAGDDILALRVHQELAIEHLFAGRRVAGEGDAGGRGLAHIAEHHGLDVDRRAPALGNVVQAPVGDGAVVHPARKHSTDGAPQLLVRVLRKRLAKLFLDLGLVEGDDALPLDGRQFGVELVAKPALLVFEDFLEHFVVEAHDDIGIHLDEAAVAVIGKAGVAGIGGQRLDRLVVQAKIEHGVHHARHRGAGAGPHRHQQQFRRVAETAPGQPADMVERHRDIRFQRGGIGPGIGVVGVADLGGDGETGRYRQAQAAHFGQIGTFAAQQILVAGATLRRPIAKGVNPLGHACSPVAGDSKDWRVPPFPDRAI